MQTWPFVEDVLAGKVRSVLPAAMVDGSARELAWNQRLSGYDRGDGFQFASQGAVHYTDSPPLLHTLDGVAGRDVP